MKAIVYTQHGLPISDPASLKDVDLPLPVAGPRDLLVAVRAISVNPVDTKIRANAAVETPRVLGWDAAGVVQAVGNQVTLFKPGDEVFYAGALNRAGSNSEFQLVDERLAGRKPRTLDFAASAALPLTAITAWELLFDRLAVPEGGGGGAGQTLLIVGAAGGVGSMLVQLASRLTALTVVGTASRAETQQWVRDLGATHVIDHSLPMQPQLAARGLPQIDIVASLTHTAQHYPQLVEILAPQGKLALIDDPQTLDIVPLKRKSVSVHWEFMFTRSMFDTADMGRQHAILDRVAQLIDDGVLRTTLGEHYGRIDAASLRRAHALLESNAARGKVVLEGF